MLVNNTTNILKLVIVVGIVMKKKSSDIGKLLKIWIRLFFVIPSSVNLSSLSTLPYSYQQNRTINITYINRVEGFFIYVILVVILVAIPMYN